MAARTSEADEELGEKTPNRRRFKSVVRKVQVKQTATNALTPHSKAGRIVAMEIKGKRWESNGELMENDGKPKGNQGETMEKEWKTYGK